MIKQRSTVIIYEFFSHIARLCFFKCKKLGPNNDRDSLNLIIATQTEDNKFMAKANSDLEITQENVTTEVASVSTRSIVDTASSKRRIFDTVSDIPEAYRVDAKPWVERPFYCDEVTFGTGNDRFSLLTTSIKVLPGDIARSNESLLNAFKMAALGRADAVLNISMAGTIGHAGCVLAAVLPPMPAYPDEATRLVNTALSGPHAFLFANEATSVILPVPWYCNTDMMTLDMEQRTGYYNAPDITTINGNYGTLVFIVMNPLSVSDSSVEKLSIIVEACFKNLDMVVPTPRYTKWEAQSGMVNPAYDDYDKVMRAISDLDDLVPKETPKKEKRFSKIQLMSISVALASLAHSAIDALGSVDFVEMVPQAGLLASIGSSMMPGLVSSVASKGTTLVGDLLDKGVGMLRKFTGLHNPNSAVIDTRVVQSPINFPNMVDGKQFFEKLDPHANSNRIVEEHIFGSDTDEMDLTHISSKDQFLGTFVVKQEDPLGKLLWARPISPFQGGSGLALDGIICANNLELLHSLHRAWRGGLKLTIQSVMNNKQQVKLKVIKMYNPSTSAAVAQPVYSTAVNAPSHLMEFSQGAQTQETDLPFLCRNALCPRTENPDAEAFLHGMYYVYLAQPFVSADGSPTYGEFNVYMRGNEDLQFYGYTTSNLGWEGFGIPPTPTSLSTRRIIELQELMSVNPYMHMDIGTDQDILEYTTKKKNKYIEQYKLDPHFFEDTSNFISNNGVITHLLIPETFEPQSGDIEVMNEPQEQVQHMDESRNVEPIECSRLVPSVNIRDIARRMYKTEALESTIGPGETQTKSYALAGFLYEKPNEYYYTPMGMASRMYYGKTVGFKFRISLTLNKHGDETGTINDLHTRVYYQPQSMNVNTTDSTINGANVNTSSYLPITTTSTIGEPPMTYQLTPVKVEGASMIYEFTIPDTSFYKFMGSPNKFLTFSSATAPPNLSTADFGSFIVEISNMHGSLSVNPIVELYVGLTDESRMGFHSIAPPFRVRKNFAYYLGTNNSDSALVPNTINTKIYYGGYP